MIIGIICTILCFVTTLSLSFMLICAIFSEDCQGFLNERKSIKYKKDAQAGDLTICTNDAGQLSIAFEIKGTLTKTN